MSAYGNGHAPRLLVTVSRSWADLATMRRELAARYRPGMILVSGHAARGDRDAERIWRELGGQVEEHPVTPAGWEQHGKSAGHRRNGDMVRSGAAECVAFIEPCGSRGCHNPAPHGSHGAAGCAGMAEKAGIPTSRFSPAEPELTELPELTAAAIADDFALSAGRAYRDGHLAAAAALIARCQAMDPARTELWAQRAGAIAARSASMSTGPAPHVPAAGQLTFGETAAAEPGSPAQPIELEAGQ